MKVAFFASAFYPNVGGVEEVCRQLAHTYVRQGHEVAIWTERWPRTLPAFEHYEGLPVHRFPMRVPASSWKSKLSYAATHQYIQLQLSRAVRRSGAELLHAHCVSPTVWYALYLRRILKRPLVLTLHGELHMDAAGTFQRPGIGQRIMREALHEADAITACSHKSLQEAEAFHGQPFEQHACVIHNGINLQEFEAAEPFVHPRPYILAIGRQVREKGFDILLQAFSLAGRELEHDLILAGDGSETAKLKALAAELSLGDRVIFPGRVQHDDALKLFKGCSFFVLPSRQEPFGLVNLEAMAAGKAIIASRVGGVPEIVTNDVEALLVPAEDPHALSKALHQLAIDSALRSRLGQAGLRRVQEFAWDDLANKYHEVYRVVQKAA